MKKEKKLITDHNRILRILNEHLLLNLPPKEIRTATGFKKIIKKIKEREALNAFLAALGVDLAAFEEICHKFGCWNELFTNSLIPVIDKYLKLRGLNVPIAIVPRIVKLSSNQPGDFIPDDGCRREQPAPDICGAV